MKIIVMSDTHGEIDKAKNVIASHKDIDLLIHLGDCFRDAERLSDMFPGINVEYVYGNSDFMIGDTPSEKLLELCGKRIFITHGHRYSVKWDYEKLHMKAKETCADIILFGHTHVVECLECRGYTLLNPGSISDSRGSSRESFAIIEISNGKLETKLVFL